MNSDTVAEQPAPGSDLPGAPPPLKRELTDEDGRQMTGRPVTRKPVAEFVANEAGTPASQPTGDTTWYLAALGLLVAAATIAADTWWRGRTRPTQTLQTHRLSHPTQENA